MQANPRTVDKLFNAQARYVVPMFQRLYVWQQNPQWSTLWEDLIEKANLRLVGTKTNPHYLGALIIEGVKPGSANEVSRLLVIDGQQRLTTLQLLLAAFRDLAKVEGWPALEKKANRYIENPDPETMENPQEEIFKLWPTQLNRKVFSDVVNASSREAVEAAYPLIRLKFKRKSEPRSNLVEAYLYFYGQLEHWIASNGDDARERRAFALLQAIQNDFCVVEISLSEGDDSQEIFYSLNSQGRPLSQSDLLRSLIFMRAEKEGADRDDLFDDFWGAFETPFWSQEVRRGGRTYSQLDIALRQFLTVKTGRLIDARRVNEEYKNWVNGDPAPFASVRDELSDFTRYTQAYRRLDIHEPRAKCVDIGRVVRDFDVSTALPLALFLELEASLDTVDQAACEALVQSFIVRRAFTGQENKEYNKFFVEVVGVLRGLKGSAVVAALQDKFLAGSGSTRLWPTDEQIVECALTTEVYGQLRQPALRVILERLELSQRGKKSETEDITAQLQIEHVMPQSWSRHWKLQGSDISDIHRQYPSMLRDQEELAEGIRTRNTLVNSLGNLTLLNQYLNPAASNGSLDLKREEYRHSVLRLNRYFDGLSEWDEHAIRKRGRLLAEALCKLYPRPQSSLTSTPNEPS
jgi:hypothetical protein